MGTVGRSMECHIQNCATKAARAKRGYSACPKVILLNKPQKKDAPEVERTEFREGTGYYRNWSESNHIGYGQRRDREKKRPKQV